MRGGGEIENSHLVDLLGAAKSKRALQKRLSSLRETDSLTCFPEEEKGEKVKNKNEHWRRIIINNCKK